MSLVLVRPSSLQLIAIGVLIASVTAVSGAHAAGLSDKQIQRLQTLSELGQEACDRGRYESCQRAFEQAQELLPWAPHRYYIAEAKVGQGQWVEGTAIWNEILKDNDPDDCHPSVCQAVRKARQRLNEVEAQVPRVRFVTSSDYEDLQVTWGDRQLSREQLKVATRVNPGQYVLVVKAAGFEPFRQKYDISPEEKREIQISLLPLAPESPATSVQNSRSRWKMAAGIGSAAVGGLGLIGGGLIWSNKQRQLKTYRTGCEPNSCRETDPQVQDIEDLTFNANALFISGGALLAAGGFLIVWDLVSTSEPSPPTAGAETTGQAIQPNVTLSALALPNALGLWCSGAF